MILLKFLIFLVHQINYIIFNFFYVFLKNHSIKKYKDINSKDKQAIFKDNSVNVQNAQLQIFSSFNYIVTIHIKNGFSQERIILTNFYLQRNQFNFEHNLPLKFSQLTKYFMQDRVVRLYFTSQISGTHLFKIEMKQKINHKLNFSLIENHDSLYSMNLTISQNNRIFLNQNEIFIYNQKQKLTKTIKIFELFENSTQSVEFGLIFDKNSLVVFGLDEQVHIFQHNSGKFKRKFIHCFDSHIKRIIQLNDVNIFAVQLYSIPENQNQNSLQIYFVQDDKLELLKKINYNVDEQSSNAIKFQTALNTLNYYFHVINGLFILVSSEETHKYNSEKVKISVFHILQNLITKNQNWKSFLCLIQIKIVYKTQDETNVQRQFCQFFLASLSKKILVKNQKEINIGFENIKQHFDFDIDQRILFSIINYVNESNNEKNKILNIFTEKSVKQIFLTSGKILIDQHYKTNNNLNDQSLRILEKQNNSLKYQKGLEKIQKPIKISFNQTKIENNYQNQTLSIVQNQSENKKKVVVFNNYEVWIANINEINQQFELISVYTMINNEFNEFKNNLSVQELDDQDFIKIFQTKVPIIQVKFINSKCIVVLYEKQLIILQIGKNQALNMKQQLKFSAYKDEDMTQNNEYSQIRIIELLNLYSETDLYLKDSESRLYRLEFSKIKKQYEIIFDRNLEEDIVCIGKVRNWAEYKMYKIIKNQTEAEEEDNEKIEKKELILKKDSQLIIKDINNKKQTAEYI